MKRLDARDETHCETMEHDEETLKQRELQTESFTIRSIIECLNSKGVESVLGVARILVVSLASATFFSVRAFFNLLLMMFQVS